MAAKGLLIILDGSGDRPQPQLEGRTPLEFARTPNLDALAAAGLCGLVDPLRPGLPVDTHTGSGILMGLAPESARRLARGPVEAAGVGFCVRPGEVALRCNFASLESAGDRWRVLDRRAGRIGAGTAELAEELCEVELGEGIVATLRPATQHRAVLLLSGEGLSGNVGDTDPGPADPGFLLPCKPGDPEDAAAVRTAAAVDRFLEVARERLAAHAVNRERAERDEPLANGLITRGAGQFHELHSMVSELGLRAAVVAAERTILGLAELLRFTKVTEPGFTALRDTDLAGKARAARQALETHELVFLHVKATDICAHDRDPLGKREVFERVDAAFAALLEPGELVVGVAADHSTDSRSGHHYGDPVPALLYTPNGRRDAQASYGESACMSGGLGRLTGTDFLTSMLDAMGVVPMLGDAAPRAGE